MNPNKTETYHWENPRCCYTGKWYYEWHTSDNLPDTKCCAMHQKPTGVPCAKYSPKPVKDTI